MRFPSPRFRTIFNQHLCQFGLKRLKKTATGWRNGTNGGPYSSLIPPLIFHLFRYFSFNQWSKMFDSYARVARKKNFWTRPQNLACPALRDNIPCKSNLVTWRDLNGCTFNLCDQAPEFGKSLSVIRQIESTTLTF